MLIKPLLKEYLKKDRICLTIKNIKVFVMLESHQNSFPWLPLKYPKIYSFQIKIEIHVTKFYLKFAVKK